MNRVFAALLLFAVGNPANAQDKPNVVIMLADNGAMATSAPKVLDLLATPFIPLYMLTKPPSALVPLSPAM